MNLLATLRSVLSTRRSVAALVITFVCATLLLFIVSEYRFLSEVVKGNFPVDLFFAILPTIFLSFFTESSVTLLAHYIAIALLFSVYITLLLYIFRRKRYLSFSSMTVSVAGLLGITLGVSCISCGAVAGLILLSIAGSAASPAFLLSSNNVFLFFGEALLLVSIVLVLVAIRRFER